MKKRRSDYLSEYITNQYPLETLKEMIFIVLDMVELFVETLNDPTLRLKLTSNFSTPVNTGGFSSQIETILVDSYNNNEKKADFVRKYNYVLSTLKPLEYDVFECSFIKGLDNLSAMEELNMYSNQLNMIKKSATVRFCERLGLTKFVYIFENENNKEVNIEKEIKQKTRRIETVSKQSNTSR